MREINLGKNLTTLRRRAGMTQEQLAEYLGVSKSSVSKWETGYAYPDICFLPLLAALFHTSVDELLGYEPQLTKEQIRRLYHELAAQMAQDAGKALERTRALVKKYYSCFPFLYQMAILYMNHGMLFENRDEIIGEAYLLCRRIQEESEDSVLVKDAVHIEAQLLLLQGKYEQVLDLLGEEVKAIPQEGELIGISYQSMGNQEKAAEVFQVCIYQHLLYLLQDSVNYVVMNLDQEAGKETLRRIQAVADLYQIDDLHFYTSIQISIIAALWAVRRGDCEKAEQEIEKAVSLAWKAKKEEKMILHKDSYFDRIDPWLKNLDLGQMAPVDVSVIKQGLLNGIAGQPEFERIKDRPRVRKALEKLRDM